MAASRRPISTSCSRTARTTAAAISAARPAPSRSSTNPSRCAIAACRSARTRRRRARSAAPGQNQIAAAVEPLIDKAAKELGLDRVAIRRVNAADNSREIRLAARARHERVSARSARARRGRVRLGSAQSAQRPGARLEGDRHRRRPGVPRRGPRRPRRHRAPDARRQAAHSLRRRQSRHVLVRRDVARRSRGAQDELGQLHHRARRLAARACRSPRRSRAATPRSR